LDTDGIYFTFGLGDGNFSLRGCAICLSIGTGNPDGNFTGLAIGCRFSAAMLGNFTAGI